jgi:hypothetical protein
MKNRGLTFLVAGLFTCHAVGLTGAIHLVLEHSPGHRAGHSHVVTDAGANAGAPSAAAAPDVQTAAEGNRLTIDPADDFVGEFLVEVAATDGLATVTDTFAVAVTNEAPRLALDDAAISHTQDRLVVDLPVADADGDAIAYSVSVSNPEAAAARLRDRLRLARYWPQYDNVRGWGEKYLQDADGYWFYILADGPVCRWRGVEQPAGNPLEGWLDAAYHADPQRVLDAAGGESLDVAVGLADGRLTIDPPAGFLGEFVVQIVAGAGLVAVREAFTVRVTNDLPDLALTDRTMSHNLDRLTIEAPAADADGEEITYTVTVFDPQARAAELCRQHDLSLYWGCYDNARGWGEKYVQDASGYWFYVLSDGRLFRWTGVERPAGNEQVGVLDARYHADPQALLDAEPADGPSVIASVDGGRITLDPAEGFAGEFQVEVTAADSLASVTDTFTVTVANALPELDLPDVTMPADRDVLALALPAADADGDEVTYSASLYDPVGEAVALRDRWGLGGYFSAYDDVRGWGERYLQDASGWWYYLLADGSLYRWQGVEQRAGNQLIGRLCERFRDDPQALLDVEGGELPDVAVRVNANRIEIDPADGFAGAFEVVVTASDGAGSVTRRFGVTVADAA